MKMLKPILARRFLALVLLAAGGFCLTVSAAPPSAAERLEAVPTISFDQLQRGQKGYGYTVFAGSEPERFEVEVLGIKRAQEIAGVDHLITRLSGHGLEKSGVAGGMSGSPVYFDGKLAGAVAFTYDFASEPIAGITPIAAMRELPAGRGEASLVSLEEARRRPAGLAPVGLADLLDDDPGRAAFAQMLDLLAPAGDGRSTLAFASSGLPGELRRLLAGRLGPLLPSASLAGYSRAVAGGGGGNAGGGPARPVKAGDSVALVMVRGDLDLSAVGTVTDRIGDQVLVFGHQIFGGVGGLGPVRFPMAQAEVVTVMPGVKESFKIANVGQPIGSFLEDRGVGSVAVAGPAWPMVPVTVKVRPTDGGPERTFRTEVAGDRLFRGFLIVLSTVGAVSGVGHDQGSQSVDVHFCFRLGKVDDLCGDYSHAGGQAVVDAAFQLMEYSTFFAFNDFEEVPLEAVEIEVDLNEDKRSTLVAAWPDRRKVAPGEKLGLWLEIEDYQGGRRRERLEYTIPHDVLGRYYLMIGDGGTVDRTYAQLEKPQPKSLQHGLELLREKRSSRELHLFGLERGAGITLGGRALPELPASQRTLFGAAAEAGLAWRIVGEKVVKLDRVAAGMVRIDLDVERPLGGAAP
jgi:hypothetical protein